MCCRTVIYIRLVFPPQPLTSRHSTPHITPYQTMEETHASYDAAITMVLEHMAKGNRAEVMIATHNQASIEHAISLMSKLRISRKGGVSFGQLLGMADNITLPLGSCGYKVIFSRSDRPVSLETLQRRRDTTKNALLQ